MSNTTVYTDKNSITREYAEVARKAKVGDLIIVTVGDDGFHTPGDIGIVKFVADDQTVKADFDGESWWVGDPGADRPEGEYNVLQPTGIVIVDGKRYNEVKRKAKVGETILITETVDGMEPFYKVGDVAIVEYVDNTAVRTNLAKHHAWVGHTPSDGNRYSVLTPVDDDKIVTYAGRQYREVKRPAVVGDLVKIVNTTFYKHPNGYIAPIVSMRGNLPRVKMPDGDACYLVHREYVVLVPIADNAPAPSAPSLEKRVATLESRVAALETAATSATTVNVSIGGGVNAKQVADSVQKALKAQQPFVTPKDVKVTCESPKASYTREQVVEMARKDVETITRDIYGDYERYAYTRYGTSGHLIVKFDVDRKKRTVTAKTYGRYTGDDYVFDVGSSHCAPDDCFNVFIGRAIALRRALQLPVPTYYTKAPKPTKVNVGDVVRWNDKTRYVFDILAISTDRTKWSFKSHQYPSSDLRGLLYSKGIEHLCTIIDDSHDFGGEAA